MSLSQGRPPVSFILPWALRRPRGEGHQLRRRSSCPRLAASLPSRCHGRTNGWSRLPGLHPRGSAQGQGRSPGAFFLGRGFTGLPATGIRRRGPVQAPQGLSPLLQFAAYAISEAIGLTSAQPGASLSGRHLLFPSRDRLDLRASVGCRILVRLPYTTPYETQGHRGARIGVFLLLRTALTMGG
ncbi:hypothetical protein NDU88_006703 [Pleurodeles waltl]|uniref:Uncharacterized protein n=1 Tax=Pleurodeles waltl TaxID=8319 RepID=A0AAV7MDL0_PLEWA|nr:hypothetical protein NDU88_006703 [Pleurodeles waltl]